MPRSNLVILTAGRTEDGGERIQGGCGVRPFHFQKHLHAGEHARADQFPDVLAVGPAAAVVDRHGAVERLRGATEAVGGALVEAERVGNTDRAAERAGTAGRWIRLWRTGGGR